MSDKEKESDIKISQSSGKRKKKMNQGMRKITERAMIKQKLKGLDGFHRLQNLVYNIYI